MGEAGMGEAGMGRAGTARGGRAKPEWAGGLRQLYDSILDEPLPESFHDLLARLDTEGDGGSSGQDGSGRDGSGQGGDAR